MYASCDTRALHGSPILFIHFKPAFSKPLFSPVVQCNRGTCVHVCHSSFAFLLVLEFTPLPFSLSHSTHYWTQGKNSDRLWRVFRVGHIRTLSRPFQKGFRAFLSEYKPAFLRVDLISHLFERHLAISPVLLVASWQFLLQFSPCKSCYFLILAPLLLKLHILAQNLKSCKFFIFWSILLKLHI